MFEHIEGDDKSMTSHWLRIGDKVVLLRLTFPIRGLGESAARKVAHLILASLSRRESDIYLSS